MALINRILVPTDFSEPAQRALEYGAELASRADVPLVLLHVYANPVVPVPDGFVVMPAVDLATMMNHLETSLGEVRQRAQALGVRQVDTAMVEGTAWSEIVRVAADRNCDLIVLGTHGRGGLAHLLLGSVAEKVVRNAECPVLTVSLKAKV